MITTQSFKKIKPLIFLGIFFPSLFWSYQFINGSLGVNPIEKFMDNMGEMALRLIVLTLFISSLSEFKKFRFLIEVRRMIGLFAFFYASIHMLSYVGLDYRFDFEPLIDDVLKKKFVFIGFSAWLLLIPLAITSSDKMARILKQNWKKLHRLIYVISIFGVLHFIWLSKTIFFKPLIFLIILIFLLLFRINFNRSGSKI